MFTFHKSKAWGIVRQQTKKPSVGQPKDYELNSKLITAAQATPSTQEELEEIEPTFKYAFARIYTF